MCDWVRDCRVSLSGAMVNEMAREADTLRRALAELVQAQLARKNDRLECRRALVIVGATDALIKMGKPANDTIGAGTEIEFRGNMGAAGWRAIIVAIVNDGAHFLCRFQHSGEISKAPIPMALLATSQFRVVRA